MLLSGAHLVSAEEARSSEDVLGDALPEKAIPQLQEILTKAMRNAPRVIDSGMNLEQAGTSVTMARAPMLPNASLSVNAGQLYQQYDYQDSNTERKSLSQALTYYAGVSQPLYHWGALKKGLQSAELQRAIADRNVVEARRLLAIDVRRAYFNLIAASNARATERVTLANLEKEHKFLKDQNADGVVTAGVASYAQTRIKDFKLQMRRTDNSYETQWAAFRQLTGIDDLASTTELPKEIPMITVKLGEALNKLSGQTDSYRPANLANADDNVRAEQLNYEIAKTRLKPKFGLNVSASQDNKNPDNNALGEKQLVTTYSAYATMSWNVFDGLTTKAAKQSSLIRTRQLKSSREQAERDYRESVKSTIAGLQLNWESLEKTEEILRDTRSGVDTYKKDFEAGVSAKKVWDDAIVSAENLLQSTNAARADYYLQIVTYLSLRGRDPAAVLAPKN